MKSEVVYKTMKVISNLLFVVLGLVLVVCLYSFVSIQVLSHKYVNFFSYTFFQIGSNSMAPAITTNDLIVVKLLDDDIKAGDIITYEDGDTLVTHRVQSVNQTGYVTKGDANMEQDRAILKDQVVGKVIKILPQYGVWFKVLTTPKIIAMICVTLFLFSIAFAYTGKKHLPANADFGIYYSGIQMKQGGKDD